MTKKHLHEPIVSQVSQVLSNLPGSKTISAPILLRGGNSESMWNMVNGTHLVVKFQSSFDNFQVHLDYFYESYSL